MPNHQNTEIIVYSKTLANNLVNNGFHLIRTEINFKNDKYRVFVFERTPEVEAMIDTYRSSRR